MNNIRKNKIYGQIKVFHPDGTLMFLCNDKKRKWYLSRNLAKSLNNKDIILTFIPKGKGHHNRICHLKYKDNKCVICGTENCLTIHHIVPYCFRRYFPEDTIRSGSYDIVPMCNVCHITYEKQSHCLRMKLYQKYNILYTINEEQKQILNTYNIYKDISSLQKYKDIIPIERQKLLKQRIDNYFGYNINIDSFRVPKRKQIFRRQSNVSGKRCGKALVGKIQNFQSFTEMWRRHFVEYTKPKFMPIWWDIHHDIYYK